MALHARHGELDLFLTEEQFVDWCRDDIRAEFVDGRVQVMSPVSLLHDEISTFLGTLLQLYVQVRPTGQVRGPEIQVRLRPNLRRVPDFFYLSNEHLDRRRANYIEGAPDAAWEIVSPESVERDWRDKYLDYCAAGVAEYWVIDPRHEVVRLYRMDAERYEEVEVRDGWLQSCAIPGFRLRPEWLWQVPAPRFLTCLREIGVLDSEMA